MSLFSCLLHTKKFFLRHHVEVLDGSTNEPESITGVIGRKLVNSMQLSVVEYDALPSPELEISVNGLSINKRYLLSMYRA